VAPVILDVLIPAIFSTMKAFRGSGKVCFGSVFALRDTLRFFDPDDRYAELNDRIRPEADMDAKEDNESLQLNAPKCIDRNSAVSTDESGG
jgi:hypothetical protein